MKKSIYSATSDYYLGLDIGTNSVGWAATDTGYNVLRFKSKSMWGVRLFDDAVSAEDRRQNRTARRRLNRRKQRLELLKVLFESEISKKDPYFYIRLSESSLWTEDKSLNNKNSLFNDQDYNDKDYLKQYPTVYHLRSDLIHSKNPHDVRLVFLAVHHIMKKRGHFLYNTDESQKIKKTIDALKAFNSFIQDKYDISFQPADSLQFIKILEKTNMSVSAKKEQLIACYGEIEESDELSVKTIINLLAGATVKLSDFFSDDELKNAEIKSISLKDDLEEKYDTLSEILGERLDVIIEAKSVFDTARLSQMLGNHSFLSDAKIALYNENKSDLAALKQFVRKNAPQKYKHIFAEKKDKLCNYAAYSRYKTDSGSFTCGQEDFCSFLKKELDGFKGINDFAYLYNKIENKTLLTQLSSTDNGLIPNQLNRAELIEILENASDYLPFLLQKDEEGLTVKEKIIRIFDFRIPYYVGPLNNASERSWIVKYENAENEKILPWNFNKTVDTQSSSRSFMENLIGRCTYTGEYVLPKDSLLYAEYMLLNEINPLSINGEKIPVNVKQKLINDLFVNSNKKVTKKTIKAYLFANGLIKETDEISGIDDVIKTKLKSLHDFKDIKEKLGNDNDLIENIIKHILVFGDDKKMLKNWLKQTVPYLQDVDRNYICRLKYTDWGRLSKKMLTAVYSPDENGEAVNIITALRNSNQTLMQLLSSNYKYAENAENYKKEKFGISDKLDTRLDEMYLSPAVRRGVRQSLKIVNEIVKIKKSAPKKIFIEVARGSKEELKGKRTKSRKEALVELYKNCKKESGLLFEKLNAESDDKLRSDRIFLYYSQFGKCMYSGEPINLDDIADKNKYDIDHIFPQSKVKDNSIDNRVLVKSEYNRIKTNRYPVPWEWRDKMRPYWKMLKDCGMISEKKYDRLTRQSDLTQDELSQFIERQVVFTQQSTKAIAALLKEIYPETVPVYSKAGNVSDFRQEYGFIKSRDVNDLHHAKDAYLNIVVGNVYDTKFTRQFFKNILSEKYSLNNVFGFDVKDAWKTGETIKTVKKYMSKNNILFTRMPYEAKGKLFDTQIMPANKGQLPVKQELPIEKYGGYNKVSGAYFAIVEHFNKKDRIRTIEPVYIYKKDLFEHDPQKYCTDVLGLSQPKVINSHIATDALVELDGKRLFICGRSNNRIILKHAYQFVVDDDNTKYIKNLAKYTERCAAKKCELPVTGFDGISARQNLELYDYFAERLSSGIYNKLFVNVLNDIINNKSAFEKMSMLSQCKTLLEILKVFKCDRQNPNFKELCGKSTVGQIRSNNNISKNKSVYLINQSVTGLFEYRYDLLK